VKVCAISQYPPREAGCREAAGSADRTAKRWGDEMSGPEHSERTVWLAGAGCAVRAVEIASFDNQTIGKAMQFYLSESKVHKTAYG